MEWRDTGVILSVKPHSETNALVEILTRDHGRHMGLVRGGVSRRQRPTLQIGNLVSTEWRARLSEHLGNFKVELITPYAARLIDDKLSLAGLGTMCALSRLLPERDAHRGIYDALVVIFDHLHSNAVWPGLMVRWEIELLNQLGFGLDLSRCAATGLQQDLTYVSPKSGRAVCSSAGEPYKDKLLKLPQFLIQDNSDSARIGPDDIQDGLALTEYFLTRHVVEPRGLKMPETRQRLIRYLLEQDVTQHQ